MNILFTTWPIKVIVALLILFTSVLIPFSYYEVEELENEKIDDEKNIPKIIFNDQLWNKSIFSTLLVGIITSSAAIVAIAFTITQIIVSNVSQKYSPKILDIYFKNSNPASSFTAFILIVAGTAALLSLYNSISPQLVVIFSVIIVNGFLLALLIFAINFRMVFRVISPYYFNEDIKEMVFKKMIGESNE